MEIENWKDIPGYEGMYEVSDLGKVKSLGRFSTKEGKNYKKIRGIIRKPIFSGRGYLAVDIYKDGKQKTFMVHQLVAMAFLDHVPCGHEKVIDHINNIKTDNRVENLQIISNRENTSKDKTGGTSKYVGVSWDKANKK